MIYKYLFLILDDYIKTYSYRNGELELTKYKGGEKFTDERKLFWSWWENVTSYMEDSVRVDFCFLSTKKEYSLPSKYLPVEYSSWEIGEVSNFIIQNTKYNTLMIYENGREKEIKIPNKINLSNNNSKLYLSHFPPNNIVNSKNCSVNLEDKEDIIINYYREKTKNIK